MTTQPFGKQLVAGDTWQWTVTLPDYPPSQFELTYAFRGPSSLDAVGITAANGSDFSIITSKTNTEALTPGLYAWSMYVVETATGNKTELGRGTVELVCDLASQEAGYDPRSFNRRMLAALEALLLNVGARVEDEYQINGRMLRVTPREKLQAMRDTYYARVRREMIESGELPPSTNQVRVSFGDPTDPVLVRLWKQFPGTGA